MIISITYAASSSTIELPADFVPNILNNVNLMLSSFGGYITLIIGIIAVALLIEIFIGSIKK
jgi:hypothetical protein